MECILVSRRVCCIQEKPYWYDGAHIIPTAQPCRQFGCGQGVEWVGMWLLVDESLPFKE